MHKHGSTKFPPKVQPESSHFLVSPYEVIVFCNLLGSLEILKETWEKYVTAGCPHSLSWNQRLR